MLRRRPRNSLNRANRVREGISLAPSFRELEPPPGVQGAGDKTRPGRVRPIFRRTHAVCGSNWFQSAATDIVTRAAYSGGGDVVPPLQQGWIGGAVVGGGSVRRSLPIVMTELDPSRVQGNRSFWLPDRGQLVGGGDRKLRLGIEKPGDRPPAGDAGKSVLGTVDPFHLLLLGPDSSPCASDEDPFRCGIVRSVPGLKPSSPRLPGKDSVMPFRRADHCARVGHDHLPATARPSPSPPSRSNRRAVGDHNGARVQFPPSPLCVVGATAGTERALPGMGRGVHQADGPVDSELSQAPRALRAMDLPVASVPDERGDPRPPLGQGLGSSSPRRGGNGGAGVGHPTVLPPQARSGQSPPDLHHGPVLSSRAGQDWRWSSTGSEKRG